MPEAPPPPADQVVQWLVEAALGSPAVEEIFAAVVEKLRAEGVAIDRAHVAYSTLHPLNHGEGATWTADHGVERHAYAYDADPDAAGWTRSPMLFAIQNRMERLRRRLAGPAAMLDFPILEEFAAEGYTDYFLMTQPFDSFFAAIGAEERAVQPGVAGMVASFATKRPAGFMEREIAALHWLLRPLALVVKMADQRQVACNLAECYIGHEAGPRVLGGSIRRGSFETTRAVVWLSDLRRSTELAATLPREDYIATLNGFFDCTAGAVEAEGGEPLTFIGDAALAIFPVERLGEEGARLAALSAADRADRSLRDLNAARRAHGGGPLDWGIALHAGDLDYGNIGSPTRHSWSVIGPVVNETARLEALTKELGEPVLASADFIAPLGCDWRAMGAFDLRGVPKKLSVFAPPARPADSLRETAA